jgi:hypothetical protein
MPSDGTSDPAQPKPRNIAIAIGVGGPERLPFLAAAHNGAKSFHAWALASGYESRLVTDETALVTFQELRAELEVLLAPRRAPIHRMLLYFAGHGLIRGAEEGLLLLSKWRSEMRAVAVEMLRRRLYRYGIAQIGIFADACRSLPPDIDALDLTADGVLGLGPTPRNDPALDKFMATQDGTATFAVPGATPDDDRCLFSGVLLEGLWGTRRSAFSTVVPDKITSGSLSAFVKVEVSALAQQYGRVVEPVILPAFPEGDNYYYGEGPPLSPPVFPPWPPPSAVRAVPKATLPVEPVPESARPTVEERFDSVLAPTHFETGAGFAVEGVEVAALWTPPGTFAEVHGEAHWWRVGDG